MELFVRVAQRMSREVIDLAHHRGPDDLIPRAEVCPRGDQKALAARLRVAGPSEEGRARLLRHPLVGDDQRDRGARVAQRLEQLERGRSGAFGQHAVVPTVSTRQASLEALARRLMS